MVEFLGYEGDGKNPIGEEEYYDLYIAEGTYWGTIFVNIMFC